MNRLQTLERVIQRYVDVRDPVATHEVGSTPTLAASARLDVYADAYRLRLLECLGKDYAGLKRLLGDTRFEMLARAYIEATPSRHFNIRWYGAGLSDYLRQAADGDERELLGEMATFEWAMGLAFDAPDEPCAGAAEIGAVRPEAWPEMVLVPLRSMQRLDLHWNAPAVRKAVDEDAEMPASARTADALPWLVWRRDLVVHYRRLDRVEAWALDAVAQGSDFAGLCEGLGNVSDHENVALLAAGMLKRWLQDGVISRIESPGSG